MCENKQTGPGAEVRAMKNESTAARATLMKTNSNQSHTHENQQQWRQSRSCVIFTTAPQPWIIHTGAGHIDDPE